MLSRARTGAASARPCYLHERPGGRALGFKVLDFSSFDGEDPEHEKIWGPPHFDAPALGLGDVPAGEIVLATRALFGSRASVNRVYFNEAAGASGAEALAPWLACLQAGDSMAHFGLGCTLHELGRYREAYRHLRHYVEIAPNGSWNWCWLGRAAAAVGEVEEARTALGRAIELTEDGDVATDAPELLRRLGVG